MPTPAIQAIIQGAPIRVEMKAPQGPGGKSAYQVAVENGFVGTEAQWLASLVGPNTVTSATTTNFTSGNVLFANSGFVGSLSRSGIDTRTSFPNDDVAAATPNSTAETIVKRDSDGAISLASSQYEGLTLSVVSSGDDSAEAIRGVANGTFGIAGKFISFSGTAIVAESINGTYHATFGVSGDNRSAVERVRGWFVWFYSTFTGRLKTANITANRDWTLPNASGTIALTSDIVDSVTSATTSDGTANLSISNVTTATATVSSLLTANHIHGNIAGTLYTHVRTGEAVSKGDPVYVSGFHNGTSQAIVMRADASDAGKMPAIGVMDADYLVNVSSANCVIAGTITSVDTDAFSINSPVYVGDGGGFSETIGTIPQQVGIVERSNQNNGAFVVTNNKVVSFADVSDAQTGTASLDLASLEIYPNGSISLASTNSGGFVSLSGQAATDARMIAFPNASGTLALVASTTGAIASADITDATSDGNANKEKVLKTDDQGTLTVTNSFGINANFGSSLVVGDGDSVKGRYDIFSNTSHLQWYSASETYGEREFVITTENLTSSGSLVYKYPAASGTFAVTASTTGVPDKLTDGTIAGTLAINTTSYTYGTGAAAAHRTALGVTSTQLQTESLFSLLTLQESDAGVYTANAGTATASQDGDSLSLSATTANQRPNVYRFRNWNRNPGVSGTANAVIPVRLACAGNIYHLGSGANGASFRCGFGMVNGASAVAANANATTGRGFGWRIAWNSSTSKLEFNLWAHDGTTYVEGTGIDTGLGAGNLDGIFNIIVGLASDGTVSANTWFGSSTSTSAVPSSTPTVTLAGGPTSGTFANLGTPSWIAAAHSTNAPASGNSIIARIVNRKLALG